MIRLGISVEGQTEEDFVKSVLGAHLFPLGIHVFPCLPGRRGGDISIPRLAAGMHELVDSHDAVTSLVDYYGFKDKGNKSPDELEGAILEAVNAKRGHPVESVRVFPYVQRHEFEALLFSDPGALCIVPGISKNQIQQIADVRSQFKSPEDVDDDPETAPSRRLQRTFPRYDKRIHGPLVANRIGLDQMRAECPRFGAWLQKIEALPVNFGAAS